MSKLLTIHELSDVTGVSAATLRAWETRHGFPKPKRSPGRHRRYTGRDVESIRAVVAERASGATLAAAIRRVRSASGHTAVSLYADLARAGFPLSRQVVSKRTMIALSRAIEDECSQAAEPGILIGAFQTRGFYESAEPRWRVLAQGAALAVVFADFPALVDREPALVPIAPRTPLEREWAVAHLAPHSSVLLVGRERPDPAPSELARRFEAYWSMEPQAVRHLVEAAARVADSTAPAIAQRIRSQVEATVLSGGMDSHFASSLTARTIGYLDS